MNYTALGGQGLFKMGPKLFKTHLLCDDTKSDVAALDCLFDLRAAAVFTSCCNLREAAVIYGSEKKNTHFIG